MTIIETREKCDVCGGVAHCEEQLHSGAIHQVCFRCGSTRSVTMQQDEAGNGVYDEAGRPVPVFSHNRGHGVCVIADRNGKSITLLTSPSEYGTFLRELQASHVDRTASYLTVFEGDTLMGLFGTLPPCYNRVAQYV